MTATDATVLQNFINGAFVASTSPPLESFNPSTGSVHELIPDSGKEDIDVAVAAAKRAFGSWSKLSCKERSMWLLRIADGIEKRMDEFIAAESRDQGKPESLARAVDIPRAVANFQFFATSILHHREHSTRLDEASAINYTTRVPVGVAGLISPWNLPLYLLTWKIAPAIAMGNTCVAKPSEITSSTASLLAEVLRDINLPNGVVNLVFGRGCRAGQALVEHDDVQLISFTGGTLTGSRIMQAASGLCKKLSLELGGKNPALVFHDADIDKAVAGVTRSSFTNQGEICLCSSRIFVHESIFDNFMKHFVDATKALRVGDPRVSTTNMGPLVSREHLDKVQSYVKLALRLGATRHAGDETIDLPNELRQGYFMRPTIFTGLDNSSVCMQEEIFGPVVFVQSFKTEDEAIALANDIRYGLSATIWSDNGARMHRVAQQLDVGTVWCNCWMLRDLLVPFGGMKASGVGREGGQDSYEFFTEAKTVCIKYGN